MKAQLTFRDTQFTAVNHNNQIYLSATQIGLALEYAHPETAVTKIYNRNADEFTDCMSQVVESTTSGNYRKKVRIFSLRGAHLIAMFARTEIAKEFRRWVLDILDREVEQAPVAKPTPRRSQQDEMDSRHIETIATYFEIIYQTWTRQLAPSLRLVRSDLVGELNGRFTDGRYFIKKLQKSINIRGLSELEQEYETFANGDDFLTTARKFAEVARKRGYVLVKAVS